MGVGWEVEDETTLRIFCCCWYFERIFEEKREARKSWRAHKRRRRSPPPPQLFCLFSLFSFLFPLSLSRGLSCLRFSSEGGEKSVAWTMHCRRRRGGACGVGGGGGAPSPRVMTKAVAVVTVVVALIALSSMMPAANAQQQQQQQPPPPSPPPPPPHSPPPAENPQQNRSVVVRDAGELRAALDDPGVSEILLTDAGLDFDLDGAEAFPVEGPPAVVGAGRALFIRSLDSKTPASLNFAGGPTPAIVVAREGALVFSQILLTSAKPPSAAKAKNPGRGIAESFAAPELGMWPSISLEPGSEVRDSWGREMVGFGEKRELGRGDKKKGTTERRSPPPAVLFFSFSSFLNLLSIFVFRDSP